MTKERRYEHLIGLSAKHFTAILAELPAEALAYLQIEGVPHAQRVLALVNLAEQSKDVATRLDHHITRTLADPVEGWLMSRAREHGWVRVIGFQDKYKIGFSLDEVFVQLGVRARGRMEERAAFRGDQGVEAHVEEASESTLEEALALANSLEGAAGIVLLGDPGAGKTTLLHHLYARVVKEGSASVGLPPDLCPVFARCSAVLDADRTAFGLRAVIVREAERAGFPEAGRRVVDDRRDMLFLLDGLDEVRDKATRAKLCDWLCDEARRWPKSRFVVTCRYAAFLEEARLDSQFVRVDVRWMDEAHVRSFVHKWFRAVEKGLSMRGPGDRHAERAEARAEALLRVALDPQRMRNVRLREMTQNPLLLSTLCLVHHSHLKLPDKRGELYEHCLNLLLQAWAEHTGHAALPVKPARLVLQPLAFAMHEKQVREISVEEAVALIQPQLARVKALTMSAAEFLEIACNECGVLASKDIGVVELFHLSFQEHLAASHIAQKGLAASLALRVSDPWWHEVILLSMTLPETFGPFVRALIQGGQLADHATFAKECLDEAIELDEAPLIEALDRAVGDPSLGAEESKTVQAVLWIAEGRRLAGVKERAKLLMNHPDRGIAAAARAFVGGPSVEQVTEVEAAGSVWREPVTGMSFVWVPPGTFLMGSSKTPGTPGYDPDAFDDETPAHEVTLTEGVWMGEHPVTNAQYGAFLTETKREEPSFWRERRFNAPEQPVVGVSFDDALAFAEWLTMRVGLQEGYIFDLPTEAEWEHAARGSDGREYPWGSRARTLERAWFGQPWSSGAPTPIGGRLNGKSPFGCHDMAGNVWEWCLDAWREGYDPHPPSPSPAGGRGGETTRGQTMTKFVNPCQPGERGAPRVIRGGSWNYGAGWLRCAARRRYGPQYRSGDLGFRLVCRASRQPWLVGS